MGRGACAHYILMTYIYICIPTPTTPPRTTIHAVAFQWVTTASSAISLVFGYISMEAQFRPCMVELGSGDALLNTTLPVVLFHPVLLSLLMNMLSLVHAILVALHVAGAELDPKGWLLRYALAALGPYFTFGLAYWFATLSVVFGESLDAIT